MKKRIIFALAFTGILLLCGCGQTRNEAVQSDRTPASAVTAAKDTPAPEPAATDTPTPEPTATDIPTPESTATDIPTPEPAATDTPTPEPAATDTPIPEPTATDTPTPEPTATDTPTPEPTATDTPTPEPTATSTPTPEPTATNTPTPTATNTPTPTPSPASKLSVKTGDVVKMGTYAGEKLEWKVIAIEGDKALVVSAKAISARAYNNTLKGTSWKDSSLRDWMNGDFLKGFDSGEKSKIAETDNDGAKDKVFALSVSEVKKYFSAGSGQNKALAVKASESANKEGCYNALEGDWWKGNCSYWLRDAVTSTKSAAYIEPDGFIADYGCLVSDDTIGVRPAMWIYPGKN